MSYASEDARAALRICEALRAEGIEVWFDQSDLRGGDAWDRMIRRQIRTCALFIAVISRHTHARREGYFRLEWKLAEDRSALMSPTRAFLVPVVIDDTREDDEEIPESLRAIHWTRLPGGETSPAFAEHIKRLLSEELAHGAEHGGVAASVAADDSTRQPPRSRRPQRRAGVVYGTIAVVALAALGYFGFERIHRLRTGAAGDASIAVLPLANESGEADQQYFSDGISEDLITALSQFPGLKVIGRTSAFQFRNSKEDSRTIGKRLGVAHLLEGSVRRSGNMVRVSAELIDTKDGSTQWSDRYDRPYKDLFALQDEITHAVAVALQARLLPGAHAVAQSDRPPSGSLEAYNAMLEGRFHLSRNTETDDHQAIDYFQRAVELDPRYALAWSGLSRSWSGLGTGFLEGDEAQQAYAKARIAADRALVLAPDLALAHLAQGDLLSVVDMDWRGAEAEYRRALELAPNDGEVKFTFGNLLATLGNVQTAIDLTQQALATEPLVSNWYNWLGTYLSGVNRLDEAERAIRKAIELQPTAATLHLQLAIIEIQRGRAQAALAAAQQESPGGWQDTALALARQIGGDRAAADEALRSMIEKNADGGPYQIAEIYALRNDANGTFEWLDRAWSNRDPGIQYLLYDPFILRFKHDPRFAAFCRKIGLPAPIA